MRQCNGVRITTDRIFTEGKVTSIQAAKFDYLGDFNYIVYASRNKYNLTTTNQVNARELVGSLKIYSPRHKEAIYDVEIPFYNVYKREKYWVAFCLKGGHGLNKGGVTVSDPGALFLKKP